MVNVIIFLMFILLLLILSLVIIKCVKFKNRDIIYNTIGGEGKSDIEFKIRSTHQKMNEIEDYISKYNELIARYEAEIQTLKSSNSSLNSSKITELESKITEAEKYIKKLKSEFGDFMTYIYNDNSDVRGEINKISELINDII